MVEFFVWLFILFMGSMAWGLVVGEYGAASKAIGACLLIFLVGACGRYARSRR